MFTGIDSRKSLFCFAAMLTLLLGAFPSQVYGQVAGATLSGSITDSSGGGIPKAAVSIRNTATDVTRETISDSAGYYTAPNLLPGSYDITFTAPGFATVVQEGITLTVGAVRTLDLTMAVGQVTQKVEVTTVAPTVELSSPTISGFVDSDTVRELPLNGRDWTTLATLQAGVDSVPVQQPNQGFAPKGNRGYGNQMTISGTRPQQNNYRLDGISINDYSNGAPGSVVGLNLGVDSIAEFSVLTANYSAEYGRTSGGVINASTRSGTNQFHGDVFEFLRNSAFDAKNHFDVSTEPGAPAKPPFRRNQFGAFVGGPIIKDKTFIFGGYEGLRQSLTSTMPNNVPSLTARTGELCLLNCAAPTAFPIATNGIGKYLAFWPAPSPTDPVCNPAGVCAVGNQGDVAIKSIQNASIATEDFFTFRVDHKISDHDGLFGTYMFDNAKTNTPDPLNTWVAGNLSRRQAVVLEENHIFAPGLVNTVRFGFSRVTAIVNSGIKVINPAAGDPTLGIYSARPQFAPQIFVSGVQNDVGGLASDPTYHYHWNSFQFYDDAFWTRGVHSLKFGFALERMQDNVLADSQPTGLIVFGGLSSFFSNSPSSTVAKLPSTLSPRGIRQTLLGGYAEDEWRIRRNLTLSLGLRYEMTTVPTEVQGKLSNVRLMTSATNFTGSPYFHNPTLTNFEPRVGFAWDPFRDGKTSVRGGFGFFDVLPLPATFSLAIDQSAPFYLFFTTSNFAPCSAPGATFPTCIGDPNNNPATATLQTAFVQFNPPRNYVMIWNLNIQRDLTQSSSIMVGYVGNRGVHMLNREDDINGTIPTETPQGLLMPVLAPGTAPQCTEAQLNVFASGGGGCVVNKAFGDIRGMYWTGDSFYDALEAQFKQNLRAGFRLQASYTFGKAIDSGSATVIGDPFQTSISSPYFFCKKCRRSLSDFDIRQSLSINLLWSVPSPKDWGGTTGSILLGGWQLGSIITAQTGVPFTPFLAPDFLGQGSADPWAFPSFVSGCHPLVHSGTPSNYLNLSCLGLPLQGSIPNAQCNMLTDPTTGLPACSNLFGDVRRNSFIGPKLVDADFSIFKNFPIHKISEGFNVQFRAEMFNVLNHANFAPPIVNDAVIGATATNGLGLPSAAAQIGNAGAIDRTTTTARQIQFGLKVNW